MPLTIINLPEEILDIIIGSLLPKLDPSHPVQTIFTYPNPIDLGHCRLVCQIFHRIASRWFCCRFNLRVFGALVGPLSDEHLLTLTQCTFFTQHSHAANVRLLQVTGIDEGDLTDAGLAPILTAQPSFASRLSNLRVLTLRRCENVTVELLPRLLSTPRLHTLVLDDLHTALNRIDWTQVGGPFPNIKQLDACLVGGLCSLISLLPSLEALSVGSCSGVYDTLSSASFPWRTMHQLLVTLEDDPAFEETCQVISNSYQNLKGNTNGPHTPLTELSVLSNLTSSHVPRLLTTFSGQPLRSLFLSNWRRFRLDPSLLGLIVSTFPGLCELALPSLTSESNISNEELSSYAEVFGRLPELQVLHWVCDCISSPPSHEPGSLARTPLHLNHVISVLAATCPRLIQFIFMPYGKDIRAFLIRDERGEYKDHVLEICKDNIGVFTSAWHIDKHPFF